MAGCMEAPYHFLRAVVPVMTEQSEGQVLVISDRRIPSNGAVTEQLADYVCQRLTFYNF